MQYPVCKPFRIGKTCYEPEGGITEGALNAWEGDRNQALTLIAAGYICEEEEVPEFQSKEVKDGCCAKGASITDVSELIALKIDEIEHTVDTFGTVIPDVDGDGKYTEVVDANNNSTGKICKNPVKGLRDNNDGTWTVEYADGTDGDTITTIPDTDQRLTNPVISQSTVDGVTTHTVTWDVVDIEGAVIGQESASGIQLPVFTDKQGNALSGPIEVISTKSFTETGELKKTDLLLTIDDQDLCGKKDFPHRKCVDVADAEFADICNPTIPEITAHATANNPTNIPTLWTNPTTGAAWDQDCEGKICCVQPPKIRTACEWGIPKFIPHYGGTWSHTGPDSNGFWHWYESSKGVRIKYRPSILADNPAHPFTAGYEIGSLMAVFSNQPPNSTTRHCFEILDSGNRCATPNGCKSVHGIGLFLNDLNPQNGDGDVIGQPHCIHVVETQDEHNASEFFQDGSTTYDATTNVGTGGSGTWGPGLSPQYISSVCNDGADVLSGDAGGVSKLYVDAASGDSLYLDVEFLDGNPSANNGYGGDVYQGVVDLYEWLPYDAYYSEVTGALLKKIDCEGLDALTVTSYTREQWEGVGFNRGEMPGFSNNNGG